jgi:hypothetical protein
VSELINALDREGVALADFQRFVQYRFQAHNLVGCARVADEEQFVRFCELFSGSFMRFPPPRAVVQAVADLALLRRLDVYEKARAAGKSDAMAAASRAILRQAKKCGYRTPGQKDTIDIGGAVEYARALKKELQEAKTWQATLTKFTTPGEGKVAELANEDLKAISPKVE